MTECWQKRADIFATFISTVGVELLIIPLKKGFNSNEFLWQNIAGKLTETNINTKVKAKNDHRSKFSNLSNWKEEA